MKKFIYFCGMMLLSLNMMAQTCPDPNWEGFLIENFDEASSYWRWDTNNFSNKNHKWKAYHGNRIESDSLLHIYQFANAQYDSIEHTMNLVAVFDSMGRIQDTLFYLPTNGSSFESIYYDNKHYFSGAIEYVNNIWQAHTGKFSYGYFEIRCKLPTHRGAFPAFWLQSSSKDPADPYYEEIDIFEYSWWVTSPSGENPEPPGTGSTRCFTTGIYHNLTGQLANHTNESFARNYPMVPPSSNDLNDWHTFGCEWMPDHVYWFFDGQLVNSFYDPMHIPRHKMFLKANYAIDSYAWNKANNEPRWSGSDEMVIDYIKVYQLKLDCNKNETITCQSDFDNFDYKLKKNISITSSVSETTVSSNDTVVYRVTDSFEVTGPFQVNSGANFTVLKNDCPNSD